MSSTSGSQNLLTNILRPVYRYEVPSGGSTAMFTPRLDVCNIDVLSANSVTAFTAAIGDDNENVYVGVNAGNDYSNLRGCSNVTAVGYSAASLVSNVKNSVYLGYNSGAGATDSSVNVAIGPNTKGNGISNIYIGSNTGSLGTGSNNILIGHNLTGTNLSNVLLIGPTPTIYGNLSTRKVGIGIDPSYNMDISGDSRISYRLGIGMAPGSAVDLSGASLSNVPHALDISGFTYIRGALGINADPADYTMNVNGRFNVDDGNGSLRITSDPSGNSVIEARPRGNRKLLFNIQGDLCASAIIIPGGSFPGNLTASNIISANDVSGPTAHITNIYGTTVFGTDVSGTTARFTTLFAGTFNPASVTTTSVSVANGTVSAPSLTFSNDISSGVYLPSTTNVAITAGGVERLRVTNTHVGIGTTVPRSALDVSTNIRAGTPGNTSNTARLEVGGGYLGDGTGSSNSYPTLAFQYGDIAGGHRHFVRTRHQAATTSASNAIDFFTNNTTSATASTAPGTCNLLAMSITSGGVGVGTSNPTVALDVSGGIRSTAAATSVIGGVTLSSSNITYGGAIINSIVTTSNVIGGVTLNNTSISNAGTTTSSNFIGTSSASNSIGGVTLNNSNISNVATITSVNFIGTSNASNSIGGVTFNNGVISNSGTTINSIGGVTLCNGTIIGSFQGSISLTSNAISNQTTTSNSIGGVTLSNSIVAAGTAVRDALTPSTYDISTGGMRASNVVLNAASNGYIRNAPTSWTFDISGGNIAYAGAITNSTATSSNSIGGVTLSNSIVAAGIAVRDALTPSMYDISAGGMRASNVVLNGTTGTSNGYIRNAATGWTFDISSGNIAYAGAITNSGSNTSNLIGGVTLINRNIDASGVTASNVVLSNTANGFIRNAATSWTTDISTGVLTGNIVLTNSNTGYIRNASTAWSIDISQGNIDASGIRVTGIVLSNTANGFIRNSATGFTIDISSGRVRTAGGTVSNPAFGFVDTDISAGMYLPAPNQLGIAVGGTARLLIDNSSIGVGRPGNSAKTALFEIGGGYAAAGASNARSFPAIAFQDGDTAGGNRHFIRTRHFANPLDTGNAIDFFTNSSTTAGGSTAPGTSNILAMSITSGGVGIGTSNPAFALDVSGVIRASNAASNAGIIAGFIRNAASSWVMDISAGYFRGFLGSVANPAYAFVLDPSAGMYTTLGGGILAFATAGVQRLLLSNSNVGIGRAVPAATLDVSGDVSANGFFATGYIRNASTAWSIDISRGNIDASGIRVNAVVLSNTNGFIRNAATSWTFDISGGNFRGGAGTVGNPTYAFIADPAAGLYLPAASNLGFTIAGVERARIDSNGALGIGTTAPLGRLDVINGGIVMNRIGNITANTDVSAIVEGSCNVGLYWQKGSNNNNCGVSFRTLANNVFAERMRIDGNTGNVGIGTLGPAAPLDVSGGTSNTPVIIRNSSTTTNTLRLQTNNVKTGQSNVISFEGTDSGTATGPLSSIAAIDVATGAQGYRGELSFRTTNGANNTIERMRVNYLGNVGIGTSNPQVPLDVSGTLRVNGGEGTANTRIVLGPSPSSANLDYASVIQSTPNTTGNFGSTLSFWTHDGVLSAAEPLQRMTIDNAGRVGIGTTAPTEQLEVTQTTTGTTAVSANVLIWAGAGGVSSISNRANLIFRVRGAGGGDVTSILRSDLDNGSSTYGISVLDGASAMVARFDVTNRRVGIGTVAPTVALDVSGVIQASNAAATAGVVAGFVRNALTPSTYDISGGRVRTAVGSVTNPSFGFITTDTTAGMYLPASNRLGIAVGGTARLLIDNSSIGIGVPGDTAKTALIEFSGGFTGSATQGGSSLPAMAFQYADNATGGFRHYIRTRHDTTTASANNAIDFFTNNSGTASASSAPGSNNVIAMSVSSKGVGIAMSNPAYTLQLPTDSAAKPTSSGWTIFSDKRIKKNIVDADVSMCYDIVKRLPLKRFTWDVSYMPDVPDRNSVGWIAQDVSFVFPRAVSRVSNEHFEDFHGLDVDQIYKSMYGAVSKLIADKEALEAKISSMSNALESLLARVAALESTPA